MEENHYLNFKMLLLLGVNRALICSLGQKMSPTVMKVSHVLRNHREGHTICSDLLLYHIRMFFGPLGWNRSRAHGMTSEVYGSRGAQFDLPMCVIRSLYACVVSCVIRVQNSSANVYIVIHCMRSSNNTNVLTITQLSMLIITKAKIALTG